MSAAASKASTTSFKELIRHSKFAAFNPKHRQIFRAGASASNSDWGFKRSLPPTINGDHVQIQDFDTEYGFTRLSNGDIQAMRYDVYAENFSKCPSVNAEPGVKQPASAPVQPNLYKMSDEEFNQVLLDAKKRKSEFKAAIEQYPIRRSDPTYASQFLGLDSNPQTESYPCTFSYVAQEFDVNEIKSGIQVEGRLLNRVPGGYAVGVAGVVAFLPSGGSNNSSGPRLNSNLNANDRTKLHTFYLQEVQWNVDGKPNIVLSFTPPKRLTMSMKRSKAERSLEQEQFELRALLDDLIESTKSTPKKAAQQSTAKSAGGARTELEMDLSEIWGSLQDKKNN